jgi:hypothetical protein
VIPLHPFAALACAALQPPLLTKKTKTKDTKKQPVKKSACHFGISIRGTQRRASKGQWLDPQDGN